MSELEKKAAAALSDDAISAAALQTLIVEIEAGIADADQIAERERERALDPTRSPDLAKARAEMEDAIFAANRLRTVLPRLQNKHQQATEQEQREAYMRRYNELKPKGEALAEELDDTYEAFCAKLVDVFSRIEAHHAELTDLHVNAPSGMPHLLDVEEQVRGIKRFSLRSLLKEVRLPNIKAGRPDIWPPKKRIDPALFAPVTNYDPRRYSDRWHEVFEEEQQKRRAEEEARIKAEEERLRANAHPLANWAFDPRF